MDNLECIYNFLTAGIFVLFCLVCILVNKCSMSNNDRDGKNKCTCKQDEFTGEITPSNHFIIREPGKPPRKLHLYEFLQGNEPELGPSCQKCCASTNTDADPLSGDSRFAGDTTGLDLPRSGRLFAGDLDEPSEISEKSEAVEHVFRNNVNLPEGVLETGDVKKTVVHETSSGTRITIIRPEYDTSDSSRTSRTSPRSVTPYSDAEGSSITHSHKKRDDSPNNSTKIVANVIPSLGGATDIDATSPSRELRPLSGTNIISIFKRKDKYAKEDVSEAISNITPNKKLKHGVTFNTDVDAADAKPEDIDKEHASRPFIKGRATPHYADLENVKSYVQPKDIDEKYAPGPSNRRPKRAHARDESSSNLSQRNASPRKRPNLSPSNDEKNQLYHENIEEQIGTDHKPQVITNDEEYPEPDDQMNTNEDMQLRAVISHPFKTTKPRVEFFVEGVKTKFSYISEEDSSTQVKTEGGTRTDSTTTTTSRAHDGGRRPDRQRDTDDVSDAPQLKLTQPQTLQYQTGSSTGEEDGISSSSPSDSDHAIFESFTSINQSYVSNGSDSAKTISNGDFFPSEEVFTIDPHLKKRDDEITRLFIKYGSPLDIARATAELSIKSEQSYYSGSNTGVQLPDTSEDITHQHSNRKRNVDSISTIYNNQAYDSIKSVVFSDTILSQNIDIEKHVKVFQATEILDTHQKKNENDSKGSTPSKTSDAPADINGSFPDNVSEIPKPNICGLKKNVIKGCSCTKHHCEEDESLYNNDNPKPCLCTRRKSRRIQRELLLKKNETDSKTPTSGKTSDIAHLDDNNKKVAFKNQTTKASTPADINGSFSDYEPEIPNPDTCGVKKNIMKGCSCIKYHFEEDESLYNNYNPKPCLCTRRKSRRKAKVRKGLFNSSPTTKHVNIVEATSDDILDTHQKKNVTDFKGSTPGKVSDTHQTKNENDSKGTTSNKVSDTHQTKNKSDLKGTTPGKVSDTHQTKNENGSKGTTSNKISDTHQTKNKSDFKRTTHDKTSDIAQTLGDSNHKHLNDNNNKVAFSDKILNPTIDLEVSSLYYMNNQRTEESAPADTKALFLDNEYTPDACGPKKNFIKECSCIKHHFEKDESVYNNDNPKPCLCTRRKTRRIQRELLLKKNKTDSKRSTSGKSSDIAQPLDDNNKQVAFKNQRTETSVPADINGSFSDYDSEIPTPVACGLKKNFMKGCSCIKHHFEENETLYNNYNPKPCLCTRRRSRKKAKVRRGLFEAYKYGKSNNNSSPPTKHVNTDKATSSDETLGTHQKNNETNSERSTPSKTSDTKQEKSKTDSYGSTHGNVSDTYQTKNETGAMGSIPSKTSDTKQEKSKTDSYGSTYGNVSDTYQPKNETGAMGSIPSKTSDTKQEKSKTDSYGSTHGNVLDTHHTKNKIDPMGSTPGNTSDIEQTLDDTHHKHLNDNNKDEFCDKILCQTIYSEVSSFSYMNSQKIEASAPSDINGSFPDYKFELPTPVACGPKKNFMKGCSCIKHHFEEDEGIYNNDNPKPCLCTRRKSRRIHRELLQKRNETDSKGSTSGNTSGITQIFDNIKKFVFNNQRTKASASTDTNDSFSDYESEIPTPVACGPKETFIKGCSCIKHHFEEDEGVYNNDNPKPCLCTRRKSRRIHRELLLKKNETGSKGTFPGKSSDKYQAVIENDSMKCSADNTSDIYQEIIETDFNGSNRGNISVTHQRKNETYTKGSTSSKTSDTNQEKSKADSNRLTPGYSSNVTQTLDDTDNKLLHDNYKKVEFSDKILKIATDFNGSNRGNISDIHQRKNETDTKGSTPSKTSDTNQEKSKTDSNRFPPGYTSNVTQTLDDTDHKLLHDNYKKVEFSDKILSQTNDSEASFLSCMDNQRPEASPPADLKAFFLDNEYTPDDCGPKNNFMKGCSCIKHHFEEDDGVYNNDNPKPCLCTRRKSRRIQRELLEKKNESDSRGSTSSNTSGIALIFDNIKKVAINKQKTKASAPADINGSFPDYESEIPTPVSCGPKETFMKGCSCIKHHFEEDESVYNNDNPKPCLCTRRKSRRIQRQLLLKKNEADSKGTTHGKSSDTYQAKSKYDFMRCTADNTSDTSQEKIETYSNGSSSGSISVTHQKKNETDSKGSSRGKKSDIAQTLDINKKLAFNKQKTKASAPADINRSLLDYESEIPKPVACGPKETFMKGCSCIKHHFEEDEILYNNDNPKPCVCTRRKSRRMQRELLLKKNEADSKETIHGKSSDTYHAKIENESMRCTADNTSDIYQEKIETDSNGSNPGNISVTHQRKNKMDSTGSAPSKTSASNQKKSKADSNGSTPGNTSDIAETLDDTDHKHLHNNNKVKISDKILSQTIDSEASSLSYTSDTNQEKSKTDSNRFNTSDITQTLDGTDHKLLYDNNKKVAFSDKVLSQTNDSEASSLSCMDNQRPEASAPADLKISFINNEHTPDDCGPKKNFMKGCSCIKHHFEEDESLYNNDNPKPCLCTRRKSHTMQKELLLKKTETDSKRSTPDNTSDIAQTRVKKVAFGDKILSQTLSHINNLRTKASILADIRGSFLDNESEVPKPDSCGPKKNVMKGCSCIKYHFEEDESLYNNDNPNPCLCTRRRFRRIHRDQLLKKNETDSQGSNSSNISDTHQKTKETDSMECTPDKSSDTYQEESESDSKDKLSDTHQKKVETDFNGSNPDFSDTHKEKNETGPNESTPGKTLDTHLKKDETDSMGSTLSHSSDLAQTLDKTNNKHLHDNDKKVAFNDKILSQTIDPEVSSLSLINNHITKGSVPEDIKGRFFANESEKHRADDFGPIKNFLKGCSCIEQPFEEDESLYNNDNTKPGLCTRRKSCRMHRELLLKKDETDSMGSALSHSSDLAQTLDETNNKHLHDNDKKVAFNDKILSQTTDTEVSSLSRINNQITKGSVPKDIKGRFLANKSEKPKADACGPKKNFMKGCSCIKHHFEEDEILYNNDNPRPCLCTKRRSRRKPNDKISETKESSNMEILDQLDVDETYSYHKTIPSVDLDDSMQDFVEKSDQKGQKSHDDVILKIVAPLYPKGKSRQSGEPENIIESAAPLAEKAAPPLRRRKLSLKSKHSISKRSIQSGEDDSIHSNELLNLGLKKWKTHLHMNKSHSLKSRPGRNKTGIDDAKLYQENRLLFPRDNVSVFVDPFDDENSISSGEESLPIPYSSINIFEDSNYSNSCCMSYLSLESNETRTQQFSDKCDRPETPFDFDRRNYPGGEMKGPQPYFIACQSKKFHHSQEQDEDSLLLDTKGNSKTPSDFDCRSYSGGKRKEPQSYFNACCQRKTR